MLAITFAVPEESSRFRRLLTDTRQVRVGALRLLEGRLGSEAVVVAHVGMGLEAAERNASLLIESRKPERLIAAGFGGALAPDLSIGDLVIDPRTWPALALAKDGDLSRRCRTGTIVSRPFALETPAEKAQLARETGAVAVDMETDAIAAVCAKAGIPLLAVRAISDAAADALPVPLPAWYDLKAQRPRPAVLVGYLLTHPGAILPFVRFLRGLPAAQRALAEFLAAFLVREERSPVARP